MSKCPHIVGTETKSNKNVLSLSLSFDVVSWHDMTCGMTWHVTWHDMWHDMTCNITLHVIWHDMWHDIWHYKERLWKCWWLLSPHQHCEDILKVTLTAKKILMTNFMDFIFSSIIIPECKMSSKCCCKNIKQSKNFESCDIHECGQYCSLH